MRYPYVHLMETSLHLFRLYCRLRLHRSGMKKRLARLLASLHPNAVSILPPATIQRMIRYQEIAEFAVCGALARMQGRRLSADEQTRLQLLSVISPMYEDLSRRQSADFARIHLLTRSPADFVPESETESLLREAYLRLLTLAADPRRAVSHAAEACHWQEASRKQQDTSVTEAELFRITYHKSFHSMLLFYTAFDQYPSPEETAMSFPMAGLMQLTGDVFDVWKDLRAGSYTVPILYRRYGRLERRFLAESARFNQSLSRLPYPPAKRKYFAMTVHGLHAMGWLAVRKLRQEAAGAGDVADLALLGRKKLVCDMHKAGMLLAWARKVRDLTNLTSHDGPLEPALKRDLRQPARS